MLGRLNLGPWIRRHGWILAAGTIYFLTVSATLIYKYHNLLNDWSFDQAYMIQQFHNWRSGFPKVTIQPGDLRSGYSGERPFEENHHKPIYILFKVFYWLWPYPETLILTYAFLTSLSVVTLYFFLKQLALQPVKIFALVCCWMIYPLQQKIAVDTFCDPLSMCGTFYFFYLYLVQRNSPYAILGCLSLLLLREQAVLLILPTVLLFHRKWKTLLWHFACVALFVLFTPSGVVGRGNPFVYAATGYRAGFISNFLLTQTVLWTLALVYPSALLIAAVFILAMTCVAGDIYFRFPYEYVGLAVFHYYGLLMPPLMAAVALGIAKLKPTQTWRLYLSLALMLVPGIAYGLCQFRWLTSPWTEAQQIQAFKADFVSANAVVVTDYDLSAAFANRDQIYVYSQPPKGVSISEMFSLADVAIIDKANSERAESLFARLSPQHWRRVMESDNYVFYKKMHPLAERGQADPVTNGKAPLLERE